MRVRHHVNPLADLTEHHFTGFSNQRPIIVDIGADRGEFTAGLLKIFGEKKNFIVSEIRKPLAQRLKDKFKQAKNVAVFDGDLVRNFKNILYPAAQKGVLIETIYLNFPDPWFKKKHKKRRVLGPRLLAEARGWLNSDTEWIFQTDQEQLFRETLDFLRQIKGLRWKLFYEPPYGLLTKWEAAQKNRGAQIYRLKFRLPDKF